MGKWFKLGDLELLVVSDGVLRLDAGAVFGLTPRVMWEPYAQDLDDKNLLGMGLNSLVVRGGGKTALVDPGVGSKRTRMPGAAGTEGCGALLENLAREGIRPDEIDIVINTHLHFDHAGGNTVDEDGKPVAAFPRAQYILQKGEWEAASRTNERTRGTYLPDNFEPLEDARQVELVEGEVEIMKGLRMTPAPGHTADHCIMEVESDGELAIYLGELAQQPVMLERVAWISAFDILPLVSLETKKRVIERAMERRALMISVHSAYPGLGRLTASGKDGSKRRWEPLDAGAGD